MGGSVHSNSHAPSRGTSPLVPQGTQRPDAADAKAEKASRTLEGALAAEQLGQEAYAAHQRGQLSEFAGKFALDAAKKLAMETSGVTAVKSALTSGKDTFDQLLNGDFEGAARSAKDAIEGGSELAERANKLTHLKPAQRALKRLAATRIATTSAKIAQRTLVSNGARLAAKAGARFVPGLNVLIAAADAKHARAVLNDHGASTWQKGTALATALGSVASASNIPLVSQAGAAISTVASAAESIDPEAALKAAKRLFSGH